MKIFLTPAFLLAFSLFIFHQFLEKIGGVSIPFLDNYLDPFLCSPILLTFLLFERRVIFKFKKPYKLSLLEIMSATFFFILVSELLFPYLSSQFTGDWRDAIGISLGSCYFYFFINQSISKS